MSVDRSALLAKLKQVKKDSSAEKMEAAKEEVELLPPFKLTALIILINKHKCIRLDPAHVLYSSLVTYFTQNGRVPIDLQWDYLNDSERERRIPAMLLDKDALFLAGLIAPLGVDMIHLRNHICRLTLKLYAEGKI